MIKAAARAMSVAIEQVADVSTPQIDHYAVGQTTGRGTLLRSKSRTPFGGVAELDGGHDVHDAVDLTVPARASDNGVPARRRRRRSQRCGPHPT